MSNVTIIPAKKNNSTENTSGCLTKVAAYCRVSTAEENQQNSYATQIAYYTEYITSNPDWQLVGIFADEGISGTQTANRTQFNKMMKLARRKKIDIILCKSISRFARNTVDCLEYVRELKALGISVRFEKETGVAMFAAAIGTKHGFYKGEPHLNFELLEEINRRVGVPVVLHGGSGIPDDMIRRAVNTGIAKLNVATELRYAATQAVRKALLDESVIDPKKFMGPARDAVRELCMEKIKLCGSEGKA